MKNKKNIDVKEIAGSPYFVASLIVVVILLIIAAIVFFVMDIDKTKESIVREREAYQMNLTEIAQLEHLRSQSKAAEKKLKQYKGILPDDLGDVFILEEEIVKECNEYGLEVIAMQDPIQTNAETAETSFQFTAKGTYKDLMKYMSDVSNKTAKHRFDAAVLSVEAGGIYTADLTLVVLSQNGAENVLSGLVDSIVDQATSTSEEAA